MDSSLDQIGDDFITGTRSWCTTVSHQTDVVYPVEWLAGDEFCDRCRVSLAVRDDVPEGQDIPAPGSYELTWRRCVLQ